MAQPANPKDPQDPYGYLKAVREWKYGSKPPDPSVPGNAQKYRDWEQEVLNAAETGQDRAARLRAISSLDQKRQQHIRFGQRNAPEGTPAAEAKANLDKLEGRPTVPEEVVRRVSDTQLDQPFLKNRILDRMGVTGDDADQLIAAEKARRAALNPPIEPRTTRTQAEDIEAQAARPGPVRVTAARQAAQSRQAAQQLAQQFEGTDITGMPRQVTTPERTPVVPLNPATPATELQPAVEGSKAQYFVDEQGRPGFTTKGGAQYILNQDILGGGAVGAKRLNPAQLLDTLNKNGLGEPPPEIQQKVGQPWLANDPAGLLEQRQLAEKFPESVSRAGSSIGPTFGDSYPTQGRIDANVLKRWRDAGVHPQTIQDAFGEPAATRYSAGPQPAQAPTIRDVISQHRQNIQRVPIEPIEPIAPASAPTAPTAPTAPVASAPVTPAAVAEAPVSSYQDLVNWMQGLQGPYRAAAPAMLSPSASTAQMLSYQLPQFINTSGGTVTTPGAQFAAPQAVPTVAQPLAADVARALGIPAASGGLSPAQANQAALVNQTLGGAQIMPGSPGTPAPNVPVSWSAPDVSAVDQAMALGAAGRAGGVPPAGGVAPTPAEAEVSQGLRAKLAAKLPESVQSSPIGKLLKLGGEEAPAVEEAANVAKAGKIATFVKGAGLPALASFVVPPLLSKLFPQQTGWQSDVRQTGSDIAAGAGLGSVGFLAGPEVGVPATVIGAGLGGLYSIADELFNIGGNKGPGDVKTNLTNAASNVGLNPDQYVSLYQLQKQINPNASDADLQAAVGQQMLADYQTQVKQNAQQTQLNDYFQSQAHSALALQQASQDFMKPYAQNILSSGLTESSLMNSLAGQLPPEFKGIMQNEAAQSATIGPRIVDAYSLQSGVWPQQYLQNQYQQLQNQLQSTPTGSSFSNIANQLTGSTTGP